MKAFPKDITVQTMTVRHIGVENELGVKGMIGVMEKELSKRGLLQNIGFDGGGREFRTNPISIRSLKQVKGLRYLTEYYGELKNGTDVLDSGGTHIHISILNTDNPNLEVNVTALATAFHRQLQKISGRDTHWAGRIGCKTISGVRDEIRNRKKANGRAYAMKGYMLNPTYHQTFEFRGPKGSNDAHEILAWIEFLDNIVNTCNRENIEGVKFKQLLNGNRISDYINSLSGWRRLDGTDFEREFNGALLYNN